jgi:signal transduction histidine kinase
LLSEYREYMLVPSVSVEHEIGELKEEIEAYESVFEQTSEADELEAGFIKRIKTAEQNLEQRGNDAIAQRRLLFDHIGTIEAFEATMENVSANGTSGADADDAEDSVTGAKPVEAREVSEPGELIHEYLSELREFALAPNDSTLQEIAAIERSLQQFVPARDDHRAFEPGYLARDGAERASIRELLEAGRISVALTGDFLAKIEDLERTEDELLNVLDEAGLLLARETDKAFEFGFAIIAAIMVVVLAGISLAAYLVSREIGRPVTALADATTRLGGGNLSARADAGRKDEIGVLAAAFNQMAVNLELNIEQRDRAQFDLKALNEELEQQGANLIYVAENLRVARDEAETASRAKSEFLAAMSHELRTPLNAIIGFSEVIKDQTFGPIGHAKYHDYAKDIHYSGQHLLDLINDILDLAKIESGTDELHEANVEVPELIDSVVRLVHHRAKKGMVELELDICDDLPLLLVDQRKLTQILVNLGVWSRTVMGWIDLESLWLFGPALGKVLEGRETLEGL